MREAHDIFTAWARITCDLTKRDVEILCAYYQNDMNAEKASRSLGIRGSYVRRITKKFFEVLGKYRKS
jgi:DNA-directed RNA polymerase specialized sigma subunit